MASKAAAWVASGKRSGRPTFRAYGSIKVAWVGSNMNSRPTLAVVSPGVISAKHALEFARWILDTFAEPAAEEPTP